MNVAIESAHCGCERNSCKIGVGRQFVESVVEMIKGERNLCKEREREKKERYINVFKRPKWPIRPNKRLHLKCFLVFENTSK